MLIKQAWPPLWKSIPWLIWRCCIVFLLFICCAPEQTADTTKQTTDRPHMVLRRLAQLDLRAASTMPRLGQYLMSPHAFAMKSPRVRQAVEKAVTVEPVGEFALKGIRCPMAAYNVLAPSTTKPH